MPTFLAGKDNKVLFGAFDLSSYFNSANFSREQEVSETTTFGSDQATYVVGVEGLSISGSATFDATADGVFAGLFDGSTVAFDYRPNNTSSAPKYTGNTLVTNYTIDSSATDLVSISFSLIVTGAVTRGTV